MFFSNRHSSMNLAARLMVGTAVSALAIGSAQAQSPAPSVETVTVTGTSIRGAQPTGSPLITLGRQDIEESAAQTTVQLLTTIPQLNGFGGTGADNAGGDGFGPTIHSVGNQSSSATLALIDGHRIPSVGSTEANSDPSLVPAAAMERIEVLPDGASAVYGSDAVTGVVNFITRRDYTGVEASVASGIANHYTTFNGAVTAGKSWDGGNVLVTYNYSGNSELPNYARPNIRGARQDIIRGAADPSLFTGLPANGGATVTPAAGPGTTGPFNTAIPYPSLGLNGQTFNCPVATIAAKSSSTTAFLYQPGGGYGGAAVTTAASTSSANQGVCDYNLLGSDISSNTRNNGLVSIRQQLSDTVVADLEVVYGANVTGTRGGDRGSISAAAFGPTATAANTGVTGLLPGNINPFYQGNATTGTATEFVRYDFTSLMGEAPVDKGFTQQYFVSGGLAWDLGNDRELTFGGVAGNGYVQSRSVAISAANADLALNGTPNTTGTPNVATAAGSGTTDIFGLGTTGEIQRNLTTLNALDVWDPAGPTNKTSPQVLASIADGGSNANTSQDLQDFIVKFDGPVFDLPAGKVKMAAGAEFMHRTYIEWGSRDANTGPSRSNATSYYYENGRQVYSAFVEVNIPLVSPEMNFPGMESLTVDVSGRYDNYSNGVGETENPKIGLDWLITDGLKARASWGSSFVAANVHDNASFNSQSGIGAAGTPGTPSAPGSVIFFNTTLPWSNQNGLGAGIAGTWVSTGPSCAAGGGTPVDINSQTTTAAAAVGCKVSFNGNATTSTTSFGIGVSGANHALKPTTGRSANLGFDFNMGKFWDKLTGLTGSVSYWELNDRGAITNQQVTNNIPQDVTFAPIGGWTQTSPYIVNFVAGRPINLVLQPQIWVTTDTRLQNAYNVWENGIDFTVNYTLPTDNYGTFRAAMNGSAVLRFTQEGGNIGPLFDVLDGKNAPRFNTTDLRGRFSLGWGMSGFNGTLSVNYIHPTHGTSTVFPYNLAGPGRGANIGSVGQTVWTSAGITQIPALMLFDLRTSYVIPAGLFGLPDMATSGLSVSFDVDNLFNTPPQYGLSPTSSGGGDIGRMFNIGLKKKF